MALQESGDPVMGRSGDWKVNPGVESAKPLFFGVDWGRGATRLPIAMSVVSKAPNVNPRCKVQFPARLE